MKEVVDGKWWGEFGLALDEAGIENPFHHRTVYTGSETQPLPGRIMETGDGPGTTAAGAQDANC